MIKKWICIAGTLLFLMAGFGGCANKQGPVKIGASFGIGAATRWEMEAEYMKAHAQDLGVELEARLNKTDKPKTQLEDCKEMIDSGIDALILMPRDATKVSEILDYAKSKNVPVISYARSVMGQPVDLYVGYDSVQMGQKMGKFLSEMVFTGDYILLRGDVNDNNATLLYEGTMRYINPIKEDLNVLLDASVPGWSVEEAKKLVKEAITANGNHVDAILAPNDAIAGACAEVLAELGVTDPVVITGMDAEINAVQRIIAGTQDMTIYLDLKELATTAVTEAVHMAKGEKVTVNAEFDNQSGNPIDANLIAGQVVTKENLDKILIDSGYFTKDQVYGNGAK